MRYTYSRWDSSQSGSGFDADELMDELSDDLMSDGDVQNALQQVTRWGLERDGEPRAPGMQSLLQQLRARRQEELERYNLDTLVDEIDAQLRRLVNTEREGIERLRLEASASSDGALKEATEAIAQRKLRFLEQLPDTSGPAIQSLADYEFLDDGARQAFADLLDTLQRQVVESHWQSMQQSLRDLSGEDLRDVKEMLKDLNSMLRERMNGGSPDFDQFVRDHGRSFPTSGSLDQMIDQLQEQMSYADALLRSMSPEMRRSLETLMEAVLRDEELRDQLTAMTDALQALRPIRKSPPAYPFVGEESLSLREALQLMRRMHELEELERDMKRAQETGTLEHIDTGTVAKLMGEDAAHAVRQLQQLAELLQQSGYVERQGTSLVLTPRGVRRIGHKALQDIFQHLKRDAFGSHPVPVSGTGMDRTDDTKRYEFGDPFLLDMNKTLLNALHRGGAGSPLSLDTRDFEVFRTEYQTRSSTVLMLDMSRSMPLRGCFVAAKKVVFALHSLIRSQFPRDRLYIIGFSDFARELQPENMHQITWGDYVYGTNMQHGFMLARRLLGKHNAANRQIILITDGEPTAHFEGDRVHFSYPPTFRTFQETLREVKRCTQEGIIINTFMLERSHYLADFVNQMTRINRGRAFFATPERLGDYILVDYVSTKLDGRKIVTSGSRHQ